MAYYWLCLGHTQLHLELASRFYLKDFSSRSILWSVEHHVRLALLDHLEERDQEVFAEEERLCRSEGYLLGDAVEIVLITEKNSYKTNNQLTRDETKNKTKVMIANNQIV